jgi:hypothetical protein
MQYIINGNGITSLGSVDSEEDLKPRPGINLNPPPEDGRCHCCGRHMSELKPFGGPGDPLVGDFSGALLIKKFRPDGPYDAEAEKAFEEADSRYEKEGFENVEDYLKFKYGEEKGRGIYYAVGLHDQVGKSWECRDCAILYEDEYFEKLIKRLNSRKRN